jgi:hypothetical protein
MIQASEKKVYIPADKSVIQLLSNKTIVTDVILNIILIGLYLGIGDNDNGVAQITRAYLKIPFIVMFWCHYYEVKQKLNQMNLVYPKTAQTGFSTYKEKVLFIL